MILTAFNNGIRNMVLHIDQHRNWYRDSLHGSHRSIMIDNTLWFCNNFLRAIMTFRVNKFFIVERRQRIHCPLVTPFYC